MRNAYVVTIMILAIVAASALGAQFRPDEATAQDSNPDTRFTADTISLDPNHPNAYTNFNPELPAALARMPQIDPEVGYHVEEVMPDLYFVTEGVYISAFMVTEDGVVVFDAPPSLGTALPHIIEAFAPDTPITHLVYSHGHTDHVGGTSAFADVPDLQIVAPASVADTIEKRGNPHILMPNVTYENEYNFAPGGVGIEIRTANFHSTDSDAIIWLPDYKLLIAVDTVTPGEVPFMNFGGTADFGAYLAIYDELLAYDFDYVLTGHLAFLATRDDVLETLEYTLDVQQEVLDRMPGFNQRVGEKFVAIGFQNANLAYRMAIEEIRNECAVEIIERWQDRLNVVDVYADSHCETVILYDVLHSAG